MRVRLQRDRAGDEIWSIEFVSNSLANCPRIYCLAVAEDFRREFVPIGIYFAGQQFTGREFIA